MPSLDMPLQEGLFGDWERVGRWFTEKSKTAEKFGLAPMQECAEYFQSTLKQDIREQNFNWQPLSALYAERKRQLGLSSLTLIATGEYLDGIIISNPEHFGGKYRIFVGADPNAIHGPSGLPMSYLGAIHEYGTIDGRVPARPHYRPTWEKCRAPCRNIWLKHLRNYARVK